MLRENTAPPLLPLLPPLLTAVLTAAFAGHGVIGALQHECSRLLCPYRTHPSLRSAGTALLDFIEHGERRSKASPGRENVVVRVAVQISLDKLMERCRFTCPASRVAAALGFLAAAGVSSSALPDPTAQLYNVPASVSIGKRYLPRLTALSPAAARASVRTLSSVSRSFA